MKTITALLAATLLLASCNQYQKTPSGLSYKITKGGSNDKLKQGQFVKFNIEYKVPPRDSVFTSSYGHMPAYMMVDTGRNNKHSFLEVITQLAPGDKMEFVMSVDTLKKLGMIEYNNIFHARDMIKGRVEILKTFPDQTAASADLKKEEEAEKQKEIMELKDYITKKGIKTQSTAAGVFVEVQNAGDAFKADSGRQARVMFRGTFMDGRTFDTNMDPKGANTEPMSVVVGNNKVIRGLEEGLKLFGKGGKGRIFIPAMLAYGQNGNPPVIPQYTNIIFDVEIVDVGMPPPPAPAVPGLPNR